MALLITFRISFNSIDLFFCLPYACFGKQKTDVSEEILSWYTLSLSADLYIHFHCLSWLRQAFWRKMIQSSAIRLILWLSQFKISSVFQPKDSWNLYIMREKWTSDLQLSAFSSWNSVNLLSSYNDDRTKNATLPSTDTHVRIKLREQILKISSTE